MDFLSLQTDALAILSQAYLWIEARFLTPAALGELLALAACAVIAVFLGRGLSRMWDRLSQAAARANLSSTFSGFSGFSGALQRLKPLPLAFSIAFVITASIAQIVFQELTSSTTDTILIHVAVSLGIAWVVIRFLTSLIRNRLVAKYIAIVIWCLAALDIFELLTPLVAFLDALSFSIGELKISVLTLVKGLVALTVLLWLATSISSSIEARLMRTSSFTPSVQVLLSKLIKIILLVIALTIALTSLGIDLSAFALFSGAIGVGIGFGLQKVVSNFISGIILLMDKSIKPGDVIQINDTYGWVTALNSRCISMITRDGTEYLIPNEDFITQQVINWSYTNKRVRLKAKFGVAYSSDLHLVRKLAVEGAQQVERVIDSRTPLCLIKEFGDSSVNMELRFWIEDPENGVSNVTSEVLLKIWDAFHEHGIQIPFPQRDIHVKSLPDGVKLSKN